MLNSYQQKPKPRPRRAIGAHGAQQDDDGLKFVIIMAIVAVLVVALVVGIIIYTTSGSDGSSRTSRRGRKNNYYSRNKKGDDAEYNPLEDDGDVTKMRNQIEVLEKDLKLEKERMIALQRDFRQPGVKKNNARELDLQRQVTNHQNEASRARADIQAKTTALQTCERDLEDTRGQKTVADQESLRLRNELQQCRSSGAANVNLQQNTQPPQRNGGYQQPGQQTYGQPNQGYQQPNQGYQQPGQQEQQYNQKYGEQANPYGQGGQQPPPQNQNQYQQQLRNEGQQQYNANQQQQQQQKPPPINQYNPQQTGAQTGGGYKQPPQGGTSSEQVDVQR